MSIAKRDANVSSQVPSHAPIALREASQETRHPPSVYYDRLIYPATSFATSVLLLTLDSSDLAIPDDLVRLCGSAAMACRRQPRGRCAGERRAKCCHEAVSSERLSEGRRVALARRFAGDNWGSSGSYADSCAKFEVGAARMQPHAASSRCGLRV